MLFTTPLFVAGRQVAEVPCLESCSGQEQVQHNRRMHQHGRDGLHAQLTNRALLGDHTKLPGRKHSLQRSSQASLKIIRTYQISFAF
jgi:hypothetical protein